MKEPIAPPSKNPENRIPHTIRSPLASAWLCVLFFLAAALSTAQADPRYSWTRGHDIRAMTQNLYLGADIRRLLQPGDLSVNVARTYQVVESTRFAERAEALARLIAREHPDVIGLQEVARFTLIDPANGNIKSDTDYLDLLLNALRKEGARYQVAGDTANPAVSVNQQIILPRCFQPPSTEVPDQSCPGDFDYLQYTDRDVLLVKAYNHHTRVTDNARFDPSYLLPIVVANQETVIPRGYLIIEAKIGGTLYRIANTHLEVTGIEVGDLAASFFQQAQASQLIGVLNAKTTPLPLVLLGDLNSAADDTPLELPNEGPNRPYQQFLNAGYVDTWAERRASKNPKGNTCCRSESLSVLDDSPLNDRIDFVFARNDLGAQPDDIGPIFSRVVGTYPSSATPSGLWPSDHAGVSSTFKFNLRPNHHGHHHRKNWD